MAVREESKRPTLGGRSHAAGVAAALSAIAISLSSGCGGDDGPGAGAAVPRACLESWNSEAAALSFGRHVYEEHDSRQGRISVLEPSPGAINIKDPEACAAVFVVPETDPEYGEVGLVVTRFGWASIEEIARGDSARLEELQRAAAADPNVAVFPDGEVEGL